MLNKKMLLSILMIGCIGVVAAGTYANIAVTSSATPTVTATAMGAPIIRFDTAATGAAVQDATLKTITLGNIVPGDGGDLQTITVYNDGPVGSTATLTATVNTVGSGDHILSWMKLWSGDKYFYNQGSVGTINLGSVSGHSSITIPIEYQFVESGNVGDQNGAANEDFVYAITFTLTASH